MLVDMKERDAMDAPAARDLAVLLLLPLAALAVGDGLYLHLWRLRLHERPECRREHLLHTVRALLFPPALVLVYGYESAGAALWLGGALVAGDTALEAWDTFEEPASRRALGGLAAREALLHVALVTLRAVSLALALASRPADAWSAGASPWLLDVAPWQALVVWHGVLPGAVAVALLHAALAWRGRSLPVGHPV
jgi:hypothetical protein